MKMAKASAQKFIEDLRSGMDWDKLIKQYGLTPERFDVLIQKLIGLKWLSQEEVDQLSKPKPPSKDAPSTSKRRISWLGRTFLIFWAFGLTALFIAGGYLISLKGYESRERAIVRHQARIDPHATEPGKTKAERTPPPGHENDVPLDVKVGLYVDRIVELSLAANSWVVDFYLWFSWKSDKLDPGKDIQIVNGQIEEKRELERKSTDQGHYALYRVTGKITKHFDHSRFPCDDHLLTIRVEDTDRQSYQLRYVSDRSGCAVSSRVSVPGYKIYRTGSVVKPHSYKTRRGNPKLPVNFKATYSQFVYGIWISRPDFGYYFKMFQGTYAAVGIALLAFFITPTSLDPRFGLGVGAFFAAVANTYISSSLLPDSGIMTLTDMVNGLGMFAIFPTIVESTIALYIYDTRGNKQLSNAFDRLSFIVILIGYTGVNVAIPLVATT